MSLEKPRNATNMMVRWSATPGDRDYTHYMSLNARGPYSRHPLPLALRQISRDYRYYIGRRRGRGMGHEATIPHILTVTFTDRAGNPVS